MKQIFKQIFSLPGRLLKLIMILLIKCYQWFISPYIGPHCRFYPTCSAYALQAIEKYGPIKGGVMALKRILRCHPWHKGGYDPVK